MTVTFSVPPEIERALRSAGRDPGEALKEAALIDLYRRSAIGYLQLSEALGLSRLETDAMLKRHDVPIDVTVEELRAELDSLRVDDDR